MFINYELILARQQWLKNKHEHLKTIKNHIVWLKH